METLRTSIKNGVGWVVFTRPHVRHAVNQEMMAELEEVIVAYESNTEVKVIVFTGDERTFVSGGDLSEFHQKETYEDIFPLMKRMNNCLQKLREIHKPTIAAVEGVAVGGGCEIAVSCDLIYASEHASFGFIQVLLGITSGWGGGTRLLQKIGTNKALPLLLSGERITSREAERIGLADRIFPSTGFLEMMQIEAERLTQASLPVIQAYMKMARAVEEREEREFFLHESHSCSLLWESPEHRNAVDAFLQKRVKKEEV
ncbi:enoyl-CoA hydratase/isomerase family protein [Mechercharimyces sp. CAU 1602]|uniref:enoyl-CoA hydratase/isomerase family protein n=1 Tax=Mechercharimyces sp. CAU 1602 TaxID=2973933 RepID=UPI0021637947|nr:enoyl-CoA hydratase/isomerase family protein [Mechercharimyces sp. CAU 1602]MCS1350603.1 enoyl-CoA hydratase/isomerase family protein [Mechercharimyces sp. CAU 1602]